jgi:hypothetical protein
VDEGRVVRVRLDLRAQCGDTAVHAAGGDHDRISPHRIHDAIASERAARALKKEFKEAVFLRGERHFDAGLEQTMRHSVEPAIAELVARCVSGTMAAQ